MKDKLLKKIKKLMALSQSSNPHEAAKALELAQKLMVENDLNQSDVLFSEYNGKQEFAINTPRYVHMLANVIEKSFGVEGYFSNEDPEHGVGRSKFHIVFFGKDEAPAIASYCFDVLYRQLQKSRKEFNATQSKRLKRSTAIARADNFCEGWVSGVNEIVKNFVSTPKEKAEMQEQRKIFNETRKLTEGKVRESRKTHEFSDMSRQQGYELGKKAKLNHGLNGKETMKLGCKNES